MKKLFKILFLSLTIIFLTGILIFYWGSSSQLPQKEYSKVFKNNFGPKVNPDSIYSIITYNIGHLKGVSEMQPSQDEVAFKSRFESTSKLLNTFKPDVIAFQDIDFDSKRSHYKNQSNDFAKLGYSYSHESVNWDKRHILSPYWPISKQTGKIISGLSLLSKFSIENYQRILLENDLKLPFYKKKFYQERIAQITELNIEEKNVIIINVHLENLSVNSRRNQFKYVLDLFKDYSLNYPTILLGDFNSSIKKNDAVIQQLFKDPEVGHSNYKNLDYIFFNKKVIEVVDSKVLYEFENLSDHLPILMRFKLK